MLSEQYSIRICITCRKVRRVADAINIAGGFAPDADRDAVNLAARLKDEQQLRIPRVGESQTVARDVEPIDAATENGLVDLESCRCSDIG